MGKVACPPWCNRRFFEERKPSNEFTTPMLVVENNVLVVKQKLRSLCNLNSK